MVKTRKQFQDECKNTEGTLRMKPAPSSSANADDAPRDVATSGSSRPASSHPTSSRSRSSVTVMAQKLRAEAEHARRLASIEEQRLKTERKIAELEHRAELAAIEAAASDSCASMYSKSENVQKWIDNAGGKVATPQGIYARLTSHVAQHYPSVDVDAKVSVADPTTQLTKALEALVLSNNRTSKISLPVFDGKSPIDWLNFKRVFSDTKKSYTNVENLGRLSYALRGAAREAVSVLLVSAREADEVIQALDMRYGRPELIVLREVSLIKVLPKVSAEGKDLAAFACRVRNCVQIAGLLEQTDYLRSPELFNTIISKIPTQLRGRWLDYAVGYSIDSNCSKIELFANFLSREVDLQTKFGLIYDTTSPSRDRIHVTLDNPKPENIKFNRSNSPNSSNKICLFCKLSHPLTNCDKFKSLSVSDRWTWIKNSKICYRCLQKRSHTFKYCKTKSLCNVDGCTYKHHYLLHSNPESSTVATTNIEPNMHTSPTSGEVSLEEEVTAHTTSTPALSKSRHPILKIVEVSVSGPRGTVDTYALLDDGSTATFIDSKIVELIGAKGPKGKVYVNCVGGMSKETDVQYVDFSIKGRHCSEVYTVRRARAFESLGLSSQSVTKETISKYSYLSDLANMLCYENAKPTIIIGVDNWHLMISHHTRTGKRSQPAAIHTALGWVVYGCSSSRVTQLSFVNNISLNEPEPFDEFIRSQYRLDSIGITRHQPCNTEDKRAIEILDRTANRLPNGRYEVGLLWKADNLHVPNSYTLALSRFMNLERKMARDPIYAEHYRKNIRDLLFKGYAEKCNETPLPSSICWYLPHFGVTNPNKPGKLRVVSDAAAKSNGVSLNSLLLTGPDMLCSLLGILFRFREEAVAMTADIKEMFPQIKIIERDREAQRFLWRENPSVPIETFRMSSMIFGAASSPFTAQYIKNKNAQDMRDQYPEAAEAILKDHYMDDYIGSIASVQQARILASEIVHVHAQIGFQMRDWVSNKTEALSTLPKELLLDSSAPNPQIELGREASPVRTLGLIWHPNLDKISMNTGYKNDVMLNQLTKRNVLSAVMRVYDPLGILAPFVIKGRIMFQYIWRRGLEWDQAIPKDQLPLWEKWFQDLALISQIQIPRCYCSVPSSVKERELHVFCDASELAFAAVAYWRFIYSDENVKLALISSKCRVSPLKPTSIPRLELQGALIASRLAATICEAHRHKCTRRFFWTDSMTVLGWLRGDPRNYKPFVAHRVGEILEFTNVNEWRWVPTNHNTADLATRLKSELSDLKLHWLCGPNFLLSSEWPSEPVNFISQNELPELKSSAIAHINIHLINDEQLHIPVAADPRRFSSWLRLVRATARAHQFISFLRLRTLKQRGLNIASLQLSQGTLCTFVPTVPEGSNDPNTREIRTQNDRANHILPSLLASNILLAEMHILRASQAESFKEDITLIKNGQQLPRRSRLYKLSPTFDATGLLRLSGRIVAAPDIDEDVRRPIILDGKHAAVRLLVLRYHEKAAHAYTEMVVNELRQTFWILHLRNTVRSVAHECQYCRTQRNTVTLEPPMGDLPEARLMHHRRPFSFVGLDYFGPVQVTIGRRREKRYVALYTCLVSRVVHLEVVHSLSTDAALMSLRRFIARRGCPTEIMSDNGTAFVGANRVLKALYGEAVSEFATNEKIMWKFIPPAAPFMGGAWRRLVRSVKMALKVTLRERAVSDEVLVTLLAEAEAVVNSRPLTHVSYDVDAPEALTPFHFILGTSSGRSYPCRLEDTDVNSRHGWRRALRLADLFWRRWVREYLPMLHPRRVSGRAPVITVGELVLIADGNLPRGCWPKGKVTAVHPGRDGIVRVVDVLTSAGTLRRPVKKLVSLT